MTDPQQIQDIQRLLAITRKANEIFDEYARVVRQEILLARLQKDPTRVVMLEAALKSARTDLDKMERALGKKLLSTAVVDSLETELLQKGKEARKLLEEMERLGKTLDRIKQVADLTSQALQAVTKLIV